MLIFKIEIIKADDVAILDPHFLQPLEQAALAQHLVKIHPAFVVGEVDIRHQALKPRPLDDVSVVVHRNVERRRGIDLRRARHVFRLVDRHRRQGGELLGDLEHQLARTGVRRGGEGEEGIASRLDMCVQFFEQRLVLHDVGLICHDDLWACSELGRILCQLCVDGVKVRDRIAPLAAGNVDHMNEQTAAVNVAKEVVAKARAVRRALDDAGDIGHDKAHALVDIDNAEVGEERGKVVIGDLRPRLGDNGEQRRLADVRKADETHIGEQLEL